jgi:hypothetical protein
MIVKKVQSNKSAAPRSKALHARDLCDYIAGPGAGDADEKVEHRGAVNLLNIDHDAQVQEMADLAETAKRSPQPVQHWILSWQQGEQPTAAQADAAVRMFLGEMGLPEHQAIYALHRNTDNCHLHIAVNRVHPETERVTTVNGGFDIEVAHRAIARIEHEQGWQREGGGRYHVLAQGTLQRTDNPKPMERQPTTQARDFENLTGQRSAQRTAIEEGAELMRRARDWQELHASLAERGMRFDRKGSGAILWVGDTAVKASTGGRDCSMAALQKRLGDFLPAAPTLAPSTRAPEPIAPVADGWDQYIAGRQVHYASRKDERERLAQRHRSAWNDMTARQRHERRQVFDADWRGKGLELNGLRSKLAARQAQEKAALMQRHQLERTAWRERFETWPVFEEWLRERGRPDLAEGWRFRERTPAVIVGDQADPARARDIRAFVPEANGWEVLYRRMDPRPGSPCFADRGRQILIYDLNRDSVLAALQLSAQKWGTFHVFGSDAYQRMCVDLAAEHGFRITNPELQREIAVERDRRHAPERRQDGGGDRQLTPGARDESSRARIPSPAPTRPPVRDVAEAYQRHFEEVRGQLHGRRADISRVDALVAVRLRATGYGRDQIERAIRHEAEKLRPSERRDWNAYARRVAEHAFGRSGEGQLRELAKTRDVLLTVEGRSRSTAPPLDVPRRRGRDLGR